MNCGECRAAVGDDARFCPVCGQPVTSSLVGRDIAGRFRILAKLGEGGMGAVYRGEQISLKRPVAVKVLRPELSRDGLLVRRFSAEAEAVAKLDHPNTVKVYDFGQDGDGSLFIAMEYIDGASLRAVLRQGPLVPARALAIAAQIAASLTDAHAHAIVHRDLKPDNVMLQDKGRQRDIVRVLDFGIAKLRDDSRATQQATMTQAGDLLGTPQYMAPEQIRGDAVDGRTDVYALGCVLYEMLAGAMAFEGPTVLAILGKHLTDPPLPPSRRRPDLALPPALDSLVLALLAKAPDARPPTMDAVAEMIVGAQAMLDPNRSGALTPTPTPAPAMSQPMPPVQARPMPPPAGGVPSPVPPFSNAPFQPNAPFQAPAHAAPTPPRAVRRGSPTLLLVVVGVLAVAAAAAIAYSVRGSGTRAAPQDAASIDPWLREARSFAPVAPQPAPVAGGPTAADLASVPLRTTTIPPNTKLNLPRDFTLEASGPTALAYYSQPRNILVALGPLSGDTNDPEKLAIEWVVANKGIQLHHISSSENEVVSLGTSRPVLWFSGVIGRVAVEQRVILYITPSYRLGLLVQYAADSRDAATDIVDALVTGGIEIR